MSRGLFGEPLVGGAGEAGVVFEAAFESGKADRGGADGVADDGESEVPVVAHLAELGAGGEVIGWVGDGLVDLAGDEAFEAAHDHGAGLGLGLGEAPGDVDAGGFVVAHATSTMVCRALLARRSPPRLRRRR
jgi:hypothetical protein